MLYVELVILFGAAVSLLTFGPKWTARPWLLGVAWALAAIGVDLDDARRTRGCRGAAGHPALVQAGRKFVMLAVTVAVAGVATLHDHDPATRTRRCRRSRRDRGGRDACASGGRPRGGLIRHHHHAMAALPRGRRLDPAGSMWLVVGLVRGYDPSRVRRFSRLAGYGLAIVVGAGILRSTNELGWGWWLHPFQATTAPPWW